MEVKISTFCDVEQSWEKSVLYHSYQFYLRHGQKKKKFQKIVLMYAGLNTLFKECHSWETSLPCPAHSNPHFDPFLLSSAFNHLTIPKATLKLPHTHTHTSTFRETEIWIKLLVPTPPPPSPLFHLVMQMKISGAGHLTKIIWKCLRWNWKNGESG